MKEQIARLPRYNEDDEWCSMCGDDRVEMRERTEAEKCCCRCQRQLLVDASAWIYCPHIPQDADFDETGEMHGCHLFIGADDPLVRNIK